MSGEDKELQRFRLPRGLKLFRVSYQASDIVAAYDADEAALHWLEEVGIGTVRAVARVRSEADLEGHSPAAPPYGAPPVRVVKTSPARGALTLVQHATIAELIAAGALTDEPCDAAPQAASLEAPNAPAAAVSNASAAP